MSKTRKRVQWNRKLIDVAVCLFLVATVVLECVPLRFTQDLRQNTWVLGILTQSCGIMAVLLLLKLMRIRLFSVPKTWVYVIPCLIICFNNFPSWAYFTGNAQLARGGWMDVLLFGGYCLSVGVFEELVFRGIVFSLVASLFPQSKKGLIKTVICSSAIFAIVHFVNLFYGAGIVATLMQVGYSFLTGGLFAFALIKTENVLIPAILHAIYNFCGLICTKQGLGLGFSFDWGTCITMGAVVLMIGSLIVYFLFKHSENARKSLYNKLNIRQNDSK